MKIYTWKCPEVKLNTQDTVSFSSACLASTKSSTTADYPSCRPPQALHGVPLAVSRTCHIQMAHQPDRRRINPSSHVSLHDLFRLIVLQRSPYSPPRFCTPKQLESSLPFRLLSLPPSLSFPLPLFPVFPQIGPAANRCQRKRSGG